MASSERGFSIHVENAVHLMRIHLWGRWNADTGEQYLREVQQKLFGLSGNHDEDWSVLLDLTGYVLPTPEVQDYLEQGFLQLGSLRIARQAILLHGAIIHLPGLEWSQTTPQVSSYFQSEDEALEWLLNE